DPEGRGGGKRVELGGRPIIKKKKEHARSYVMGVGMRHRPGRRADRRSRRALTPRTVFPRPGDELPASTPMRFFFFQAEDGIRDHCVTGVQTCALPISSRRDRKSTRLNSSHTVISYAVFCLDRKSTCLNSSHTVISYAVFCL